MQNPVGYPQFVAILVPKPRVPIRDLVAIPTLGRATARSRPLRDSGFQNSPLSVDPLAVPVAAPAVVVIVAVKEAAAVRRGCGDLLTMPCGQCLSTGWVVRLAGKGGLWSPWAGQMATVGWLRRSVKFACGKSVCCP